MERDPSVAAEIVILGAGISGLVGASVLLAQGFRSIVVVDEYPHVGGNHIDAHIGDYTFDIGSLIFQDDSPLLDHFPQLLSLYVPVEPKWSRLNPQGVVTEYPFSLRDDFAAAGVLEMARMAASAVAGRLDRRRMSSAHDFARRALGARFLERSGLEHYMERFYGCPIEEIELAFAESRMAWVRDQTRPLAVAERLRRALLSLPPPPPDNIQLVRPRAGFAALYEPVVRDLTARGVSFHLGASLHKIRKADGRFEVVSDAGVLTADRVVSTIPVHRTMALIGLTPPPLPTVTLVSLFYSFSGRRGFDDPIVYNFTREARWKRLTAYSDFYGRVHDREYFTVEVVGGADDVVRPEDADQEFRAHAASHEIFVGDLRLEGHDVLEQAYPVYVRGSGDRAAAARSRLAREGIDSFGRQGAFEYQPTARASTLSAESALGSARR